MFLFRSLMNSKIPCLFAWLRILFMLKIYCCNAHTLRKVERDGPRTALAGNTGNITAAA